MWGTKLPKKSGGRYLITLETSFGGAQVRQADLLEYPKGNFYWSILPSGTANLKEVTAWMKEPKPYKKKDV